MNLFWISILVKRVDPCLKRVAAFSGPRYFENVASTSFFETPASELWKNWILGRIEFSGFDRSNLGFALTMLEIWGFVKPSFLRRSRKALGLTGVSKCTSFEAAMDSSGDNPHESTRKETTTLFSGEYPAGVVFPRVLKFASHNKNKW
ncbi:Sec-independent protein translocase protein TatC [Striga asiatica]|uniref:Sec-independent protein translocase protein TatC n=1 Tax=Striga asiatica TaxID=4170 RepID=A0A5A7PRG4_STRAF|nr:Sec-independent protein translocase protein TatC [Striga asiatica]